ncbi:MAG: type II toxin-antitoxin system HipA family toxin [Gammaproteobacteria bacterium]|nr:type II toxin-antitoxin system HipA family toxin [Gammaproteobacteria bacterium]
MTKTTQRVSVAIGRELHPVGELLFESDGRRQTSAFRYRVEWLDHPGAFPIAPTMPLVDYPFYAAASRENPRSALPPPVDDGAPDSWGRGLIRKARTGWLTELDFLLNADDITRQGALRYLDSEGRPVSSAKPPIPRLTELRDVNRLAGADPDSLTAEERERLLGSAGSLGGARPKANVLDDRSMLMIAKFTTVHDTTPIERVEVATLRLARAAGINAATARLELAQTSAPVALIERFDRHGAMPDADRVPYLSARSFVGAETATGAFYTDIADALRAHAHDVQKDIEELFRRMLFTILVSNNDNHLKNLGLLHVGRGLWSLAPAFDINPQPARQRHLETGVSELSGNAASIEAAIEAAPFFDIKRDHACQMLAQMVSVIESQWRGHCRAAGLTAGGIRQYEGAFEHEETRTAKHLCGVP